MATDQVYLHFLMQLHYLIFVIYPIQALEHPKFKEMIDIASHATNGVKILGRKGTHAEIMRILKIHLKTL